MYHYGVGAMASSIIAMNEAVSLVIAAIIVALVFGSSFLVRGDYIGFLIVTVSAILAVIPHELMHRWSARRMGCYSRYVLYPFGVLLTLLTAIPFIPFKVIMPGFVLISCHAHSSEEEKRINGVTSFAGPVTNLFIASLSLILLRSILVSMPIGVILNSSALLVFLLFLAKLNGWVAFFNLLPIPPLDGSKIIRWRPILWVVSFILSIIIMYFSG